MANSCIINKGRKKTKEIEWGEVVSFVKTPKFDLSRGGEVEKGGMVYVDKYPTFTDDGEHAA